MADLACRLAGDDLVWFARMLVEVKDEFKCRREAAVPIARYACPLVPDVEAEAAPTLAAHPVEPALPVGQPFVVAMDQAQVDQHLAVLHHDLVEPAEHTAHQRIPITDTSGRIVTLIAIRRTSKKQMRTLTSHDACGRCAICTIAA